MKSPKECEKVKINGIFYMPAKISNFAYSIKAMIDQWQKLQFKIPVTALLYKS